MSTIWRIVTDSSCDLRHFDNITGDISYCQVPFKLSLGDTHYTDDDNLDLKEFMEAMAKFKGAAISSCPSPDDWYNAFKDADCIFAITITSGLSGSYNSAIVAKDMLLEKYPDKKIHIIDSLSTGGALVLAVNKLNELINTYHDFTIVSEKINEYMKRNHTAFALVCLDNLVKNGRVSKLVATVSSVLKIALVGRASEQGTLEVLHKARGTSKAYFYILQEMKYKQCNGQNIIISHCLNENGAKGLASVISETYPDANIQIVETNGLDSFYAEKQGLIIGFESI